MVGLVKSDDKVVRFFGLFITVLFFVLNIKGNVFAMNGLSNLLIVAYVCLGMKEKRRHSFQKECGEGSEPDNHLIYESV